MFGLSAIVESIKTISSFFNKRQESKEETNFKNSQQQNDITLEETQRFYMEAGIRICTNVHSVL